MQLHKNLTYSQNNKLKHICCNYNYSGKQTLFKKYITHNLLIMITKYRLDKIKILREKKYIYVKIF